MLERHRQFVGRELVVTASEGEQVLVEVQNVDRRLGRFSLREVCSLLLLPRDAECMHLL